jgi:DNA-binding response OmpR family regulator
MPQRVAVLDDDTGFVQVLTKRLERLGWEYEVRSAALPADALARLRVTAVVVDLALLGERAREWLESVARELPGLGIVVCTAGATVAQRVHGLRLGADDWLAKPSHPEEVIARVEAVLRRRRYADGRLDGLPVRVGELVIRADQFQAFVGDRPVGLTRREFELLELLASAGGRVFEREDIYQRVWGYAMVRGDRSVDVFVRKLRSKLERASPGWRYIHTHFGVGYRLDAERVDGAPDRVSEPVPA